MPLLEVEDLHIAYGGLEVVRGVSLSVEPGEIITILGSNGAGKTTILRCLAGLIHAMAGGIRFNGRDIGNVPAHAIASLGLALVPEGRQLFPEHTVRENLNLAPIPACAAAGEKNLTQVSPTSFSFFPV